MAKESRYREEFEDRYGIVQPYLRRFPFEDEEEFDYSQLYYDSEDSEDAELYNDPATHELLKKYVQQIRDSFGFDVVEGRPPIWFEGPFAGVFMEEKDRTIMYDCAMQAAEFAIREINSEISDKSYTFVELKKAVSTTNFLRLVTIMVKEVVKEDVKVEVDAVKKEKVDVVKEEVDAEVDKEEAVKEVDAVKKEEVDAVKEEVDAEVDVDDGGGVIRTIQAIVYYHFYTGLELHQWRFKPTDTVAAVAA